MQRISTRGALAGGLLAVVAAVAVVLSAVVGGSGALATGSTPTNTPGPTPTPKSADNTGEVDGVYDIVVDAANPAVDLFHCIAFIAHDGTTDAIKLAAQCHDNTGAAGNADAEPLNDAPGEGPSGDLSAIGPPPPPPYNATAPSKGTGTYNTGTDDLTLTACIPEIAGPLGPNIIAVLSSTDATGPLGLSGAAKITASVLIYGNQTDTACNTYTPAGPAPGAIFATLYAAFDDSPCPSNDCVQAPFRTGPDADWDNDGCSDTEELDKNDTGLCGDDPWNPNDTSLTDTDVAGDYTLLATVNDEDCNPALGGDLTACEMPGERVPGLYYSCVANIAQAGKVLTARLSCYIDSPALAINPQAAKDNTNASSNPTLCGALPTQAPADYCGDGSPGSPPPGITIPGGTKRNFGDVDTAQPQFTGTVDNAKHTIIIQGCFPDLDGFSGLGNVYATATVDMSTGHGWVLIHQGITAMADCQNGPPFADGAEAYVPIDLVRQTKDAVKRDSDSDKCADRKELGDMATAGGLRDPSNHYDYMEATQNGQNRINDIIAVVNQYFIDDPVGVPDMKSLTDRTAIVGGNPWNLGPPNGQQRVDDILAQVKQYFHDCNLT